MRLRLRQPLAKGFHFFFLLPPLLLPFCAWLKQRAHRFQLFVGHCWACFEYIWKHATSISSIVLTKMKSALNACKSWRRCRWSCSWGRRQSKSQSAESKSWSTCALLAKYFATDFYAGGEGRAANLPAMGAHFSWQAVTLTWASLKDEPSGQLGGGGQPQVAAALCRALYCKTSVN